jgi:hypothetical protein
MAKWSGYFKVVQPSTETTTVTDNQAMDGTEYGNYSWYQRLVQGSASRISRYGEYDVMDSDVEVARALDIIAEEMTSNNEKTDLPIDIDVQAEDVEHMAPNTLMTLRAALRYWSTIHDWENRLFKISRTMAKYGDCFFRRPKDPRQKWTFIHPKLVLGAIVDESDVTRILAYQIKSDTARPMGSIGQVPTGQQYDSEIVPASEIVRFTLNDDMSSVAPFGESILSPVYRAHKQKEMLEDAIIIYRTVRAPERRVFYIDVGKMPPAMTKKYLEQIKNEIRQRKIPSANGGQTNVDSVYNAQSMSEDFYFAQRADGKGSRVETLPGGAGLGELADLDHFLNKVFRGLRIPLSWMNEQQGGQIFNDGKVGQAYIQELIFGKYVQRLQGCVDRVLDIEFKKYLRENRIMVDESMYKIRLPESTNFAKFRQAEVDASLLSTYASAADITHMSKRFGLARYAQWSEDEILANEKQVMEERGIPANAPNRMQLIYGDPATTGADFGMPGGGGGGGGGGLPMGGPGDLGDPMADPAGGDPKDTSTTDTASKQNSAAPAASGAKPGAPAGKP